MYLLLACICALRIFDELELGDHGQAVRLYGESRYFLANAEMLAKDLFVRGGEGAKAANDRLNQPGGYREKAAKVLALWASGRFDTHAECAQKAAEVLNISVDTAVRALYNAPEPKQGT